MNEPKPTTEDLQRVLANLEKLSYGAASLEQLLEAVGYELEAEPLERDALDAATKRLAESWGITERPTLRPSSTLAVRRVARTFSHAVQFVPPENPHIERFCEECSRRHNIFNKESHHV